MNNPESRLIVSPFVLGPVQTNTFLVGDIQNKKSVVIDPAWDGKMIVDAAKKHGLQIESIWLTHAHFDHIGGVLGITSEISQSLPIALHPDDYPLWKAKGGASYFGMRVDPGPEPTIWLANHQQLKLGDFVFEVRHCPGHTPGHVIFYCALEKIIFCGDVLFNGSIGRTDLPGGDYQTLMDSIKRQILILPEDTRLFTGHGPETTIGVEKRSNPFLIQDF